MDAFENQEEYENYLAFSIPQSEIDSALSSYKNQLIKEPFLYDNWNSVNGLQYLAGICEHGEYGGSQYLRTLANVTYETDPSHYIIQAFLQRLDEFKKIWGSCDHPEINPPQYFVKWALSKKLPMPWLDAAIKQSLLPVDIANDKQSEQTQLLLELNKTSPTYPSELDIAIRAWLAISATGGKGKPKQRIREWLNSNTTELSNEAKERISTVANWDKKGGATSTD